MDFAEECLWVGRRVYKTDVDPQKSDRSTRQVALSEGTVDLLKKWFDRMIRTDELAWVFSTENSKRPLTRDFVWTKRMLPFLKPIVLDWATFQVSGGHTRAGPRKPG